MVYAIRRVNVFFNLVFSLNNVIAVKKKYLCILFTGMFQSTNIICVVTKTHFFSFCQLTVEGLKYLHSRRIAHSDLKPGNVLVGNSHYSSLAMEDMGTVFLDRPIICKLTNFGESRSHYAQTHMSVLASLTSRVDRGTVSYMSPEILLPGRTSGPLSMDDLMRADV